MPTLFSRRYMRDHVPRTEKMIGIVCLLLTAGIAVAFVSMVLPVKARPYFYVDPAKETPAVRPEIKHARSLLPESPAPGWVRAEPVEAVEPGAIERSMPGEAGPYVKAGVQRMYQARYQNRADARQQLTVRVFDVGAPDAAKALFDATRPKLAVGEPAGVRGWRAPDGAVGFQSGRYVSLVSATNVPADATLTPKVLAREVADRQVAFDAMDPATAAKKSSVASGAPGGRGESAAEKESLLPAGPAGIWGAPESVSTYNPANLWEKIDGRAEQYLQFDFERLVFGTYRLAADRNSSADVYIYEMREPVKAFGIYQVEKSDHAEPIALGKEGYRGKGTIFFHKGKAYVQIVLGEESKATDEQFVALAKALADSIKDEGGGNWAEAILPKEGMVAGSLQFQPKDAFNLDFLTEVFSADYEIGGEKLTLFILRTADEAAARKLFEQYDEYVKKLGKLVARTDSDGAPRLIGELSGEFDVVFAKGRYFGGATAASTQAAAEKGADGLRAAIKSD